MGHGRASDKRGNAITARDISKKMKATPRMRRFLFFVF